MGSTTVAVVKAVLVGQRPACQDSARLGLDVRISGQSGDRPPDEIRRFGLGKVLVLGDRIPPILFGHPEVLEH